MTGRSHYSVVHVAHELINHRESQRETGTRNVQHRAALDTTFRWHHTSGPPWALVNKHTSRRGVEASRDCGNGNKDALGTSNRRCHALYLALGHPQGWNRPVCPKPAQQAL